jgi:hypothetical protein
MNHYLRDREEFFNRSIFSPAGPGWIEIDFLFTYWTPDPCVRTCSQCGGLLDSLPGIRAAAAVDASASRGDGRNGLAGEEGGGSIWTESEGGRGQW